MNSQDGRPAPGPVTLTDRLDLAAFLVALGHEAQLIETGTSKKIFAFRRFPLITS